mmetsp:Transcript_30474/g.46691  ORF Transcript_30474/g.46691 Transcript_30474/m.46691 type:complete len:104 (-) Transcript_30474:55-366(-)
MDDEGVISNDEEYYTATFEATLAYSPICTLGFQLFIYLTENNTEFKDSSIDLFTIDRSNRSEFKEYLTASFVVQTVVYLSLAIVLDWLHVNSYKVPDGNSDLT